MKLIATLCVALLGASPVLAAERLPDLSSCRTIKDNAARVDCYDALADHSPTEAGRVIAQWSGSGMTTTRPFHADGPFEIQWEAKGFFSATLVAVDGGGSLIANQADGGRVAATFRKVAAITSRSRA